jgi:hypothetical protein
VKAMKMIIWKAPRFLSPFLRRLFAGRGKQKRAHEPKSYIPSAKL